MKKSLSALFLLTICVASATVFAKQKYEAITVKSREINNGVVIVTVQEGSMNFQLQCDANVAGCDTLSPGSYVMVRLPKNWGTYVCANVEVYPTPVNPENLGQKLGDYCIVQK
jgi:hypothetical protein